jgi:hypothetical protein
MVSYALGRSGKKSLICLVDDVEVASPCRQSLIVASKLPSEMVQALIWRCQDLGLFLAVQ